MISGRFRLGGDADRQRRPARDRGADDKWGRNHLLWGQALDRQGKGKEARVRWQAASRLDLSAADKAAVAALLAGLGR